MALVCISLFIFALDKASKSHLHTHPKWLKDICQPWAPAPFLHGGLLDFFLLKPSTVLAPILSSTRFLFLFHQKNLKLKKQTSRQLHKRISSKGLTFASTLFLYPGSSEPPKSSELAQVGTLACTLYTGLFQDPQREFSSITQPHIHFQNTQHYAKRQNNENKLFKSLLPTWAASSLFSLSLIISSRDQFLVRELTSTAGLLSITMCGCVESPELQHPSNNLILGCPHSGHEVHLTLKREASHAAKLMETQFSRLMALEHLGKELE